jgi:glycosyltransferase involved in cell wall biosynthesis
MKNISLIIPAMNESQSLEQLTREIVSTMKALSASYEILFIDDGSTDKTLEKLKKLRAKNKKIKIVSHRGNWGKAVALQNGFTFATGDIVITLDADLQDNPHEIPKLLKKLDQGYDLVSGWKKTRHDPLEKVIPSRIFNTLVRILTGLQIHDINCGFKAYRREVLNDMRIYGELYRFIPVLAHKANFKVTEVPVEHRARVHGKSKYGLERHIKGFLDLITIVFLTGYGSRPGHFFGTFGIASFSGGFLIGLYITYLRLTTGTIQDRHPLLFLGILLMIVGIQLATTGLLSEMIVSFNQKTVTPDKYIREKFLS